MEGVLFHRLGALKERAVAAIALVEIDLADDLIRRVHAQHRNTGVDHAHAVLGAQIGDRSAAAEIDAAQFRRLERHTRVIHDLSEAGHKFRVRVVAAGLAAAAGELVEADAAAEERAVLLFNALAKFGS